MEAISLIQYLVPESYQLVNRRLMILRTIHQQQPIGRRGLAKLLNWSERTLRTELETLKMQRLIDYSTSGMTLTETGSTLILDLPACQKQLVLMNEVEQQVAQVLGISFCRIVSDSEPKAHALGKAVETLLRKLLPNGEFIIAVTGGQTMADLAESFSKKLSDKRKLTFVPARGGMGGSTHIQSNSVSERMAEKTNGQHFALHVPEHVSRETYHSLIQEPLIAQSIAMMKSANCLLYSVGDAAVMAKRRGLSRDEIEFIRQANAVGEAFGSFFNAAGEVVYKLPRIGLHLNDVSSIPYTFAIVDGEDKARALHAYAKLAPYANTWFVLGEGVANQVLNEATRKK